MQLLDGAGEGRGYIYQRLRRLHLAERLVERDALADLYQPLHELGFFQPFAQVRQEKLTHLSFTPTTFPTAP
jgi:hypothetical protein